MLVVREQKVRKSYWDIFQMITIWWIIAVISHNANLKKWLEKHSTDYKGLCNIVQSDDEGGAEYEIKKYRSSFRCSRHDWIFESRKEKACRLIEKNQFKGGDSMWPMTISRLMICPFTESKMARFVVIMSAKALERMYVNS